MKVLHTVKHFKFVLLIFAILIGYLLVKTNSLEAMSSPAMADMQLVLEKNDHLRGDKNAQIIIFEFSDFECPFCQKIHPELEKLVQEYDGKVAWVFKHFPISSHRYAQEKAEVAECVADIEGNDAFWTFAENLFDAGTSVPMDDAIGLAANVGVDKEALDKCLESGNVQAIIQDHKQLGEQYGVSGTPGNVILNTKNGKTQFISGALPYESFKLVINNMLAE